MTEIDLCWGGRASIDVKIKIGIRVDEEKGFEEIRNYSKYYGNSKEEGTSSWESYKMLCG